MNQINYLSDIKILENYPKTDNFVYHFTTDGETCYDVSLEKENCRKEGDYLVICLDNHGLPEGQLKVRREFHFPDDDFPDKEWTKIVEHSYDIYLSEGVDVEADCYVLPTYMPIFRGEKGDDYVITEEDYDEIATLTLSKIDWEEVLKNKQDKLNYYNEIDDSAFLALENNRIGVNKNSAYFGAINGNYASNIVATGDILAFNTGNAPKGRPLMIIDSGAAYYKQNEIATKSDFKTINGESVIGEGDIKLNYEHYTEDHALATIKWGTNAVGISEHDATLYSIDSEDISSFGVVRTAPSYVMLAATNNSKIEIKPDWLYYNGNKVTTENVFKTINNENIIGKGNIDLNITKTPNVTIFGDLNTENGQLRDFSVDNYAQFPFLVDFKNKSFTISMCVTTPNDLSGQHNIFDSEFGLAFAIRDGKVVLAASTDGVSWDLGEHVSETHLKPNYTYYLNILHTGTQYVVFISIDKEHYTPMFNFIGGSPYPKQIIIGKSLDNSNFFNGSINLNYCNVVANDVEIWQGMDDLGVATRLATDLSNIDAAGEAKIKEIAGGKYYFETEEDDGNVKYREAGIRLQGEEDEAEAAILVSDYKSSDSHSQTVGFGVSTGDNGSTLSATPYEISLIHNHFMEGGYINAALGVYDDGVVMSYENDGEEKQVILNNDGFFYNDSPIATEEYVDSKLGDIDTLLTAIINGGF